MTHKVEQYITGENTSGTCTDDINRTIGTNVEQTNKPVESEQVATELVEDHKQR